MSSSTYLSPYSTTDLPAEARPAGGTYVWLTLPLFCLFFMLQGHDFTRSTLWEEGFSVDGAELQERVETGMLRYRLAFVGTLFVGGLLLVVPGGAPLRIRNLLAPCILATVGWVLLSVVWSNDPSLTLRRAFTLLCSFIGAMGIARAYKIVDICWLAFTFTFAMAVLGIFCEVILGTFRPWDLEYRFAGLLHPNSQGVELSVLMLSSVTLQRRYPTWRPFFMGVVAAAAIGLVLTKSRTSTACCILAFIALWTLNTSMRAKLGTLLVGMMLGGLFFGILLSVGVDDPDRFAQVLRMGREEGPGSFTGRIPIWITVSEDIAERPWTGYGFNSYFDEDILAYIAKRHGWPAASAHNAYIETVLNLGLIGVALMLCTVFFAMYLLGSARVRAFDDNYSMFFALGVFALVNGLFESMMVANFHFAPCLLAAAMCRLAFFEDIPNDSDVSPQRPRPMVSRTLLN